MSVHARHLVLLLVIALFGAESAVARAVRFSGKFSGCGVEISGASLPTVAVVPCGGIVDLPPGVYLAWATQPLAVASEPTRVDVADKDGELVITLPPPNIPAGEVAVQTTDDEITDIIQVPVAQNGSAIFRVRAAKGTTLLVPAGKVVAVGRSKKGFPRWVSLPFAVSAGERYILRRREPQNADALAELSLSRDVTIDQDPGRLALDSKAADIVFRTNDGIFAAWYELAKSDGTFVASGRRWFVPSQPVSLRKGAMSWIHHPIEPLPSLNVLIRTDRADDVKEPLSIVVQEGDKQPSAGVPAKVGTLDIPDVPAGELRVSLRMGKWTFTESVDSHEGGAHTVVFDLKPFVVTGSVTYAGAPVLAKVGFDGDVAHEAITDDRGSFRIVLWSARRYGVTVTLPNVPSMPMFTDTVRISADRVFDIHIPATAVSVRVVTDRTREAVAKATVTIKNKWVDELEGERGNMMQVVTDTDGEAVLPPLRKGTIDLIASAPGFAPGVPSTYVITSEDQRQTITLQVKEGGTSRVTVSLEDGRPAVGAIAAGFVGNTLTWSATSDDGGVVIVPEGFDGRIAVRHAEGAGTTVAWHVGMTAAQCHLPSPMPPLRARIVNHSGDPVGDARIIVWSGDTPVYGNLLMFLFQAPPVSFPDGSWQGRNLPQSVRVAALSPESAFVDPHQISSALATIISYPLSGLPTVRVIN